MSEGSTGLTHKNLAKHTHEMLMRRGVKDFLTGLYNRRGFEEQISTLVSVCKRQEKPISFLMADIDNFKSCNDEWGHEAGDQALIFVAGVLKDMLRESDVAGRYGGDEFVVALPFTDSSGAKKIKQRILEKMQKSLDELKEDNLLVAMNISVSIGISTMKPEETANEAFKRADQDMYKVKRSAKNE